MSLEPTLQSRISADRLELVAAGPWTRPHVENLEKLLDEVAADVKGTRALTIDVAAVDQVDSLGALLIDRAIRDHEQRGIDAQLVGVPERYRNLYRAVHRTKREASPERPTDSGPVAAVASIGESAVGVGRSFVAIVDMLGALGNSVGAVLRRPGTFRLTSTLHHIDRVGWQAVPIVVLITFLIGAIIAQQGFFHFRRFGAGDYVVDLVGILVLREIGVLIVAIMVAGRSGSSYTAELGAMKMREEIDALRVMALDPVEVLMLPRVVALIVALPVLAFIGSMSALVGGGLVAWLYADMSPAIYIARLKDAISITHFEVGMIKAPFIALVIGVVACSEGMQVKGSAESLGVQTTASVVKSIFLVIVLDGLFAIFFASIGM